MGIPPFFFFFGKICGFSGMDDCLTCVREFCSRKVGTKHGFFDDGGLGSAREREKSLLRGFKWFSKSIYLGHVAL